MVKFKVVLKASTRCTLYASFAANESIVRRRVLKTVTVTAVFKASSINALDRTAWGGPDRGHVSAGPDRGPASAGEMMTASVADPLTTIPPRAIMIVRSPAEASRKCSTCRTCDVMHDHIAT